MGRLLQMHEPIRLDADRFHRSGIGGLRAQRRWLYLRVQSGEIYRYFDFPPDRYRDFLAAESKGTYFGKYIRKQFRYEHLPRSLHAGG